MKTFTQALEDFRERGATTKAVFDKKISGVQVRIYDEQGGFVVYIEGDRLDKYNSLDKAKKMADEFVKQYKG